MPPHSNPRGGYALLDLGGIVGTIRSRVGKDPAFFRWHSLHAPLQNDLGQGRMQRNVVLGVFGLDVIHPAVHEAALNEKLVFVEIEVVPLKRRDLAHAKTEALGDLYHQAPRLLQSRNDEFELLNSQSGRTLPALAAALDANQCYWDSLLAEDFPARGTLIHQVHHALQMRLGPGGHSEILQPILDCHRSNLFK